MRYELVIDGRVCQKYRNTAQGLRIAKADVRIMSSARPDSTVELRDTSEFSVANIHDYCDHRHVAGQLEVDRLRAFVSLHSFDSVIERHENGGLCVKIFIDWTHADGRVGVDGYLANTLATVREALGY
jgi:hypothetical protein